MRLSDLVPFRTTKAPGDRIVNELNKQLFRYNKGLPISLDDTQNAYIEDGYEFNPDVYSVINGITKAASAVPPCVHIIKDQKKALKHKQLMNSMRRKASQSQLDNILELKEQAFEMVEDDRDPLYKLINNPNPLQGYPEWYENMKGFQLITGNGYTHFVELGDGTFGEMWVMPSQFTKIVANPTYESLIQGYVIDMYGSDGHQLEEKSVMHWKYWNPDYDSVGSHLYGMSPLKSARRSIRLGNDGDQALSKALKNGGASGVVYPTDPDLEQLTPMQRSQLENYLRTMQGPDNYKSWLVSSVKLGFEKFGMPPVDLEIIEAGKMSQRDICNVYNFPSELLNDPDNKTNANKEQSRKQLYLDNVIPELARDFAEMNRCLVPYFSEATGIKYHLDFDVQSIDALSQDRETTVNWLDKAWWLTADEKRIEMGYEPLGDNSRYIPMNLVPDGNSGLTEDEINLMSDELSGV
jgi:HK97 family phage portal protein